MLTHTWRVPGVPGSAKRQFFKTVVMKCAQAVALIGQNVVMEYVQEQRRTTFLYQDYHMLS